MKRFILENENIDNTENIENTSDCFKSVLPDELEFLASKKTKVNYLKGETIFKQGAFAPFVLYMVNGLARVYLQSSNQKQLNIRLVKQGDFMAFSAMFGENVYTYSATAIKDSTICMIEKEALTQLLLKNPEFAMRITSRKSFNEHRLLEIIDNFSNKQMRGKISSTLLYLSSDNYIDEDVFQYLTRQDIADFAGITLESAIKFIKEFEKDEIVRLEGKKIVVENRKGLIEISRVG